jgi:uncharacterized protein YpmB
MNIHESVPTSSLDKKSKRNIILVVAIIIALLCIMVGVAYWYLQSRKNVQPLSEQQKQVIIQNLNTAVQADPLTSDERTRMIIGDTPQTPAPTKTPLKTPVTGKK